MSHLNKISTLVAQQLPEFIRDDSNYDKFMSFVEAYYEWLELANTSNSQIVTANTEYQGVTYATKNLQAYDDIDTTLDGFVDYYINDFLPNFPQDALSDRTKVLKIAKQLFTTKGTPASYKLLFRVLYNTDAQLQYTKDLVFRPSWSEWYIPQYLKIKTTDLNWLLPSVKNLRVFGETTKSFAVIENIVQSDKIDKFNVYISQMERVFQSGETIRVVDSANQDVYFKDGEIVTASTSGAELLTAKVVGALSSININRNYRGLKYEVGDPVVVYGGLNDADGLGAKAEVEETTKGSIQSLNLINKGHGYRLYPNSEIKFIGGGGSGAIAEITSLDPSEVANVSFLSIDVIGTKQLISLGAEEYNFTANSSANLDCTIANALSFISFSTSPIDSIIVQNGGGGYSSIPEISAISTYQSETYTDENTLTQFDIQDLSLFGIMAPIVISDGGLGYAVNDKIVFSGGTGVGAYANVTSVNSAGSITSVEYVANYESDAIYPLGGFGYNKIGLPSLTVNSANVEAYGASLYVPGILGAGATFNAQADRIGSITKIKLIDSGEDYITTPNVSFRVQDLIVTNVSGDISSIKQGTVIYQGPAPYNYEGLIDSTKLTITTANTSTDVYRVRVYNYRGALNYSGQITAYIPSANVTFNLTNQLDNTPPVTYTNGIKTYGNGTARGAARFLNGLIFGSGIYLNKISHPSNYSVLQSELYNDYTYVLSVEQPISKYRDLLKRLLHPAGMRLIGRNIMKSEKNFDFHSYPGFGLINPLQYWLDWPVGDYYARVSMNVDSGLLSTNTINVITESTENKFDSILPGDFILIEPEYGPKITSKIHSTDSSNSIIRMDDDVWLKFPNVAYGYSNTELNKIQVSDFSIANTPNYDIVNNKNYSDQNNHIKDIVFVGDEITIAGNTFIVRAVDYENGLISIDQELALLATDPDGILIETNQPTANNILIGSYIISAGTKENPVPFTINRTINTNKVFIKKLN